MKVLRSGKTEWMPHHHLGHDGGFDRGPRSILRDPAGFGLEVVHLRPAALAGARRSARSRSSPPSRTALYDATDLPAAEDLAHRATIAIENASLLAALKEADRRKDEFLAMLAHELRNPLAPIRNAVQILRAKGPPMPELQWATEVIERQVQQMTRLVDDLLDVSRITQRQDRAAQGAGRAGRRW